jgi:hypothetical protein
MRRALPDRIRLLALLIAFPYLVGFAPPDSAGTSVSFSGGSGAYPTATCSRGYQNEYSEYGMAVDHRIATKAADDSGHWATPRFVGVGAFGSLGPHRETVVYDEEGYGIGTSTRGSMWNGGAHVDLEWAWLGLDFGARVYGMPDNGTLSREGILPRLGLRLGPPAGYLFSSIVQRPLLFADGDVLEGGLGIKIRGTRVECGGGLFPDQGGLFRIRQDLHPLALAFSIHGTDRKAYGLALTLEYRLPSSPARPRPGVREPSPAPPGREGGGP